MDYIIYNGELYHWGIKGMKWGVRRYQNKDGSLTPAGRKRYADDKSGENISKKPTRYDNLYSKYKTLGYSDEKAKQAAKGHIKAERALAIVGGVAVTAAVAYGAYRWHDSSVDRVISSDRVMQTVHKGDISERLKPGNPFYATYTKKDNTIYASRVFSHFDKDSKVTRFYTKDGIKAASEKTGRKIFDELVSTNPEVAAYSKRIGFLRQGKNPYQRFNYSLVLRNDSDTAKRMGLGDLDHDKIHNIFYDELKKRGYGAVIDVNDSKIEGFTFNPVIVFDDQIKHVVGTAQANASQLSGKRMAKGIMYSTQRQIALKPVSKSTASLAGITYLEYLGVNAMANRDLNKRVEFVNQYIKDHPDTKLSKSQIAKMYK